MSQPINTFLEVTFRSRVNEQICLNIFHYKKTVVGPGNLTLTEEYVEILNAMNVDQFGPELTTRFKNAASVDLELLDVRVQFVAPIRYVAYLSNNNVGAGTINQPCEVQNVQATIVKRTNLAGKRYRGAFRMPGIPQAEVANGLLVAGYKNGQMLTLATALLQKLITASSSEWDPVVFHRVPPPNLGQSSGERLTSVTVQPEIRTQRTRTVGRGI